MKHKGSVSDFKESRNEELYAQYRREIRNSRRELHAMELCRKVAETGASRYWVSEYRAAAVIGRLLAISRRMGKASRETLLEIPPLNGMVPERARLYLDLFSRLQTTADDGTPLICAVSRLVNGPAPRHYLSPETVMKIVRLQRRKAVAAMAANKV